MSDHLVMGLFGRARRLRELEQQYEEGEPRRLREKAEEGRRVAEMERVFVASLPPASTLVEEAVETAVSRLTGGYADLARPAAIALARKFARPDEQILAVMHQEERRAGKTSADRSGL